MYDKIIILLWTALNVFLMCPMKVCHLQMSVKSYKGVLQKGFQFCMCLNFVAFL